MHLEKFGGWSILLGRLVLSSIVLYTLYDNTDAVSVIHMNEK